jgi:hypothetical protein
VRLAAPLPKQSTAGLRELLVTEQVWRTMMGLRCKLVQNQTANCSKGWKSPIFWVLQRTTALVGRRTLAVWAELVTTKPLVHRLLLMIHRTRLRALTQKLTRGTLPPHGVSAC